MAESLDGSSSTERAQVADESAGATDEPRDDAADTGRPFYQPGYDDAPGRIVPLGMLLLAVALVLLQVGTFLGSMTLLRIAWERWTDPWTETLATVTKVRGNTTYEYTVEETRYVGETKSSLTPAPRVGEQIRVRYLTPHPEFSEVESIDPLWTLRAGLQIGLTPLWKILFLMIGFAMVERSRRRAQVPGLERKGAATTLVRIRRVLPGEGFALIVITGFLLGDGLGVTLWQRVPEWRADYPGIRPYLLTLAACPGLLLVAWGLVSRYVARLRWKRQLCRLEVEEDGGAVLVVPGFMRSLKRPRRQRVEAGEHFAVVQVTRCSPVWPWRRTSSLFVLALVSRTSRRRLALFSTNVTGQAESLRGTAAELNRQIGRPEAPSYYFTSLWPGLLMPWPLPRSFETKAEGLAAALVPSGLVIVLALSLLRFWSGSILLRVLGGIINAIGWLDGSVSFVDAAGPMSQGAMVAAGMVAIAAAVVHVGQVVWLRRRWPNACRKLELSEKGDRAHDTAE